MTMHQIILVDDESNVLNAIRRELMRTGAYEVEVYDNAREAMDRMIEKQFDLIISDYRMPQINGVQLLTHAKETQPDAIRLILSGYSDLDALLGAINEAEIYRFISKPWNEHDLRSTIQKALEYKEMLSENKRLAEQVREQQKQLDREARLLAALEAECPGITKVEWQEDGSIYLDESET